MLQKKNSSRRNNAQIFTQKLLRTHKKNHLSRHSNKIWCCSIGKEALIVWLAQMCKAWVHAHYGQTILYASLDCIYRNNVDENTFAQKVKKRLRYWWPNVKSQKQFSNSNYQMQWQGYKMATNLWTGNVYLFCVAFCVVWHGTYIFNGICRAKLSKMWKNLFVYVWI